MVTGAGGFLGSHISRHFSEAGHHVYDTGRMKLPDDSLIEVLRDIKPTVLVHCAGSSSIAESMRNPYDDFQDTVGLTAFVLESIRQAAPNCKFIFPSSAAIYGNPSILPIPETADSFPISPYGVHKRISEKLIEEYSKLFGISYAILRIFSAYGDGLRKQVVFDLCRKFAAEDTDHVEVYGNGSESRDFVHVSDICRAAAYMLQPDHMGVFNLSSGRQTTIQNLTELIKKNLNSPKPVHFTGSGRPGDPLNWQADISKISSLGYQPEKDLGAGIREYCEWFHHVYLAAH